MKKVKNTESNKTEKLKTAAKKSRKTIDKPKKDKKNKIVRQEAISALKKEEEEQKSKKVAKSLLTNGANGVKPETKELDEIALAKIEKKKAKKLAKKFKKKQLKEQQKSNISKDLSQDSAEKIDKKIDKQKQKPQNNVSYDITKSSNAEDISPTKKDKKKKNKSKNKEQNAVEKSSLNDSENAISIKNDQQKKNNKKKQLLQKQKEGGKVHPINDPDYIASTIFVGNLPITTKRVQIVKLFAKFGEIRGIRLRTATGQIIYKHKQRKLAGSLNAYVVLKDAETAKKALELNGTELRGNHLRITAADKQKTQNEIDPKRTVFIGNLKYTANENKLREIFSNCGKINYIRCLGDGKNGCKGVAYVCFKSAEAVGLALELNETLLDERPIHVERYSKKKVGAKEARDKQEAAEKLKSNKKGGAKQRLDAKQKKKGAKSNSSQDSKEIHEKKKSDFHGVKAKGINKKKHSKKQNNEMKGLAKKIAPIINKKGKAA